VSGSDAEGAAVAPEEEQAWQRHPNGRWIVGEPGNQPDVVAVPPALDRRRSDIVIDGARVGRLDFRAVSLRGVSHLESGKPRQDAYLVTASRDERWLVGCVADGVSQGKLSHKAAELAGQEIVGALLDHLNELDAAGEDADLLSLPWKHGAAEANTAIKDAFMRKLRSTAGHAEVQSVTEADARAYMSSTAVAFVVATGPGPDGCYPAAVTVAAGDSSAFLLSDGGWRPVTEVKGEGQEVASSAVRPLPRDLADVRMEPVLLALRPGDVLAVITDGVGDPLGAGRGVVGAFLAEQWRTPPDTLEFAHHVAFYRKTFVDDRTAVVVWVASEPA
jgi:hypothetical protein